MKTSGQFTIIRVFASLFIVDLQSLIRVRIIELRLLVGIEAIRVLTGSFVIRE